MRRTERSVEGCNVMNELWKDIPGYEGKYQASTEGRIRSLSRPLRGRNKYGEFTRMMAGRVLRPSGQAKDPHLYVRLGHGANGSPVHQLVARTFLGPRPPGEELAREYGVSGTSISRIKRGIYKSCDILE